MSHLPPKDVVHWEEWWLLRDEREQKESQSLTTVSTATATLAFVPEALWQGKAEDGHQTANLV